MYRSAPFVLSVILLLSLPLLLIFAPRIFSPRHAQISVHDELDDLALFHRATLASVRSSASAASTKFRLGSITKPKIAFLFLTNSDLVFSPLWEQFFGGEEQRDLFNIYIHCDPTVKISPPDGVFKNRFIPSRRTERGSPTLISAERRLLAAALLDDPANAYFALLSQSCIPLHSFQYVYSTLFPPPSFFSFPFSRHSAKSFIEILDDEPTLPARYIARGKSVMLPEVPYKYFRVGSQFFIVTRNHALLIIKERKLWRKFRLPCLDIESCYPEEHYFPMLLEMEDPDGCTRYTLTRVNWTDSYDGHPHTYHPPEVSAVLIDELRKSNNSDSYLFARKFSPDCLKPLLVLADSVIFKD